MVKRETAGLIQQQLAINRLVVPEGKTGECPPVVVRKVFLHILKSDVQSMDYRLKLCVHSVQKYTKM